MPKFKKMQINYIIALKTGEFYLIAKREFFHQGLKYSFNWEPDRMKIAKFLSKTNQYLYEYLKKVYQNQIPFELFNDRRVERISNFRIKGLPKGGLKQLSEILIEAGEIEHKELGETKLGLSEMADVVYTNWQKENFSGKPGHDPILKYILINHEKAIAIETPIWKSKPKITGHIDLIMLIDDTIYIVDYKPERNYLRSLPQVAYYGLLLGKKFRTDKIKCVQFSKEDSWEYNPKILIENLPNMIDEALLEQFPWCKFTRDPEQ